MPVSTTEKSHAGRVAIVTGAARGIGQAIAVGLATQGATLVIGDVGDLADTTMTLTSTCTGTIPTWRGVTDVYDTAVC